MAAQADTHTTLAALVLGVELGDFLLAVLPVKLLAAQFQNLTALVVAQADAAGNIHIALLCHILQAQLHWVDAQFAGSHVHAMLKVDVELRRAPAAECAADDGVGQGHLCMEGLVGVAIGPEELTAQGACIVDGVAQIGSCIQQQVGVHILEHTIRGEGELVLEVHGSAAVGGADALLAVVDQLNRALYAQGSGCNHRLPEPTPACRQSCRPWWSLQHEPCCNPCRTGRR